MTKQKDLKRLVRARMLKTGEAYTAARMHLLRTKALAAIAPRPIVSVPAEQVPVRVRTEPTPTEYAKLAGMSDSAVKARTGCGWESWVKSLDHHGAAMLSHAEIAGMVRKKWKVGPWWGQMVAVGYERIRGLRARGQQRSGTFNASKSRTFAVPVGTLFDAWADVAARRRWMKGAAVTVRTATKPKSMRLELDGGTIAAVTFASKGKGKSAVAVEQTRIASREAAVTVKAEWTVRFDALAEVLATQS